VTFTPAEIEGLRHVVRNLRRGAVMASALERAAHGGPNARGYSRNASQRATDADFLESIAAKYSEREDAA